MSAPQPRPSDLQTVPVRLRVSVDKRVWEMSGDELDDAIRTFCVEKLQLQPAIYAVRRDRDTR